MPAEDSKVEPSSTPSDPVRAEERIEVAAALRMVEMVELVKILAVVVVACYLVWGKLPAFLNRRPMHLAVGLGTPLGPLHLHLVRMAGLFLMLMAITILVLGLLERIAGRRGFWGVHGLVGERDMVAALLPRKLADRYRAAAKDFADGKRERREPLVRSHWPYVFVAMFSSGFAATSWRGSSPIVATAIGVGVGMLGMATEAAVRWRFRRRRGQNSDRAHS